MNTQLKPANTQYVYFQGQIPNSTKSLSVSLVVTELKYDDTLVRHVYMLLYHIKSTVSSLPVYNSLGL